MNDDDDDEEVNKVLQALESLPADDTTSAFREATSRVPHLVLSESDPARFFRCKDGNEKEAAKLLAFYWTKRKEIFKDRAFLPMNLTGEGALTPDDIEWMKPASCTVLPETDNHGRTIICIDRSRTEKPSLFPMTIRQRMYFYMLTVCAENKLSQSEGVVFLFRLTEKTAIHAGDKKHPLIEIPETMFPIKIHSVHLACCFPRSSRRMLEATLIPVARASYSGEGFHVHVHVGESKSDLMGKLLAWGFSRSAVPNTMGGDWDYEEAEQWRAYRVELESDRLRKIHAVKNEPESDTNSGSDPKPAFVPEEQPSSAEAILPNTVPSQMAEARARNTDEDGNVSKTDEDGNVSKARKPCKANKDSGLLEGENEKGPKNKHERDDTITDPTPVKFRETSGTEEKTALDTDTKVSQLLAVLEGLPADETSAFREAASRVPHLVLSESDPARFLRCKDGKVKEAAKLLAFHWTKRKEIFKERAFLPMNLTGEEALTTDDIEWFKHASCTVLPETDSHGRTIICMDRSRTEKPSLFPMINRLRLVFYMMNVTAENKLSQSEGVVFLVHLTEKTGMHRGEKKNPLIQVSETMFPIKIHSVHLACCFPRASRRMLEKTLIPVAKASHSGEGFEVHVHVGGSKSDLMGKLLASGFSRSTVPNTMGGDWDYEEAEQWRAYRAELESERCRRAAELASSEDIVECDEDCKKPAARKRSVPAENTAGLSQKAEKISHQTNADAHLSDGSGAASDEKMSKLRKRNAMYSRRKYYKKKRKVQDLMQDRYHIEVNNTSIRKENERLECLLAQAKKYIEKHGLETRERNAELERQAAQDYPSSRVRPTGVPAFSFASAPPQLYLNSSGFRAATQGNVATSTEQHTGAASAMVGRHHNFPVDPNEIALRLTLAARTAPRSPYLPHHPDQTFGL